jgi:hypothetical protein
VRWEMGWYLRIRARALLFQIFIEFAGVLCRGWGWIWQFVYDVFMFHLAHVGNEGIKFAKDVCCE